MESVLSGTTPHECCGPPRRTSRGSVYRQRSKAAGKNQSSPAGRVQNQSAKELSGDRSDPIRDEGLALTIVDGLIGYVPSSRLFTQRFHGEVPAALRDISVLPNDDQAVALEDWAYGLEVEAMMEMNPFFRELWRIKAQLGQAVQVSGYQERWDLKTSNQQPNAESLAEQETNLDAQRISSGRTIKHSYSGEQTAKVEIRNVGQPGTAEAIASQIAELLVWRKLWRRHQRRRTGR